MNRMHDTSVILVVSFISMFLSALRNTMESLEWNGMGPFIRVYARTRIKNSRIKMSAK